MAQDFGNIFENPDWTKWFTEMDETDQWLAPDESNAQGIDTNANLHRLFAVLGYDLFKLNDDVFFTNFCLGYRSGKTSGGMTKKMLLRDRDEFKKLCDILEPENILCLGKITFKAVLKSLLNFRINNMPNYNDFLDSSTFFPAKCGNVTTRIFPLAHCGTLGTLNRSLEKQIEDWRRIAKITSQPVALDDISDDEDSDEVSNEIPSKPKYKQTALYGAILGDIIGSPFEFADFRQTSKEFKLFSHKSKFTDDTIMTMAVADAILKTGNLNDGSLLYKNVESSMHSYGRKYSYAGYGGRFYKWLRSDNPKPYGSLGNGSAMRVSAAGWVHDKMFETRECARMTARPTHNHSEGIKGAVAVASAIFLARSGKSKEEIKNYIESEFNYNLSRSLDEIRVAYKNYAEKCTGSVKFDETCPGSVPEAIIAFLKSTDFEDTIRNAVSLGGDTDTQAAIAGSIAEAFYGIPDELIQKCREFLPEEFLKIVDEFNQKYCPDNDPDDDSDDQPKDTETDENDDSISFEHQIDNLNTLIYGARSQRVSSRDECPAKFAHKKLTREVLTKQLFDDAQFIHRSVPGAMGEADIFEIWTKDFEHYKGFWSALFDVDESGRFFAENAMPSLEDFFNDGWYTHYMGAGHCFFIRNYLDELYLLKFKRAQENGANYFVDMDIPPVEKIMIDTLRESKIIYNYIKEQTKIMESAIDKFELPQNMMAFCRADISLLPEFERMFECDGIFINEAFTSTTALQIGSTENEIEICFLIPKAIGIGAYIAPMSEVPDECEFVLNCGTFFKVIEIKKDESGHVQVVLAVIGRSPKELN